MSRKKRKILLRIEKKCLFIKIAFIYGVVGRKLSTIKKKKK